MPTRSQLIAKAASLPKGDSRRREILTSLARRAGMTDEDIRRYEAEITKQVQKIVGNAGKVVHVRYWHGSVWQASFSTECAAYKAAYAYRSNKDLKVEKDARGWTMLNGRV